LIVSFGVGLALVSCPTSVKFSGSLMLLLTYCAVVGVPPFHACCPRKKLLSHQNVFVTVLFRKPWSASGVLGVPSKTVVPLTLMLISPLAWSPSLGNVWLSWSRIFTENMVVLLLFTR